MAGIIVKMKSSRNLDVILTIQKSTLMFISTNHGSWITLQQVPDPNEFISQDHINLEALLLYYHQKGQFQVHHNNHDVSQPCKLIFIFTIKKSMQFIEFSHYSSTRNSVAKIVSAHGFTGVSKRINIIITMDILDICISTST